MHTYKFPETKIFISMDSLIDHGLSMSWDELKEKFGPDEYFYQLAPHGSISDAFRIANYFRCNIPYEPIVRTAKLLVEEQNLDVYVIDRYVLNSDALTARRAWLDVNTPFLSKRFYPMEVKTTQFVKDITGDFNKNYILIDSLYKDLLEWTQGGGTAIKLLKDVPDNNTKWTGNMILGDLMAPGEMEDYIMSVFAPNYAD